MGLEPNQRERLRQQSLAWEWVSRVLSICVVMVLPGLGGGWIDRQLGTEYWTLVGFVLGFFSGITALILLVQRDGSRPGKS